MTGEKEPLACQAGLAPEATRKEEADRYNGS